MKRRILWLLNHKTLMKFEVKLLRDLGYEVYIPKVVPFDVSVGVDWESDNLLTIEKRDLDVLNQFDFYETRMTEEIVRIINQYFDIAMFIHLPVMIESLVDFFQGVLVLRAYGRYKITGTYTDVILHELGISYLCKIQKLGKRFVFGESYKGISEMECDFFRDHTQYMPIGLPDCTVYDRWTGKKKKVLFICPRISISPMYKSIYEDFKKNFSKIPHSIGGVQPIPLENDPTILGYLPQEEYEEMYPSHTCLFYESTEENQLTYPPLEAVRCGLPLIFMAGGMLDQLGGRELIGRCKNIKEARQKMQRLIKGDRVLAEKIRESQGVLLHKFSYEFCQNKWEKAMSAVEKILQEIPQAEEQKKKLAVILPEGFLGGVLDFTVRLIKAIKRGAELYQDSLEIIFGYAKHENFKEGDPFREIKKLGISIREFVWDYINSSDRREIGKLMGIDLSVEENVWCVMNDHMSYFNDCDALLFTSDRVPALPFIMQPYGVIAHDYIQRLIPDIFSKDTFEYSFIQFVRGARAVFTTTPVTRDHAIQYAGVSQDRIHIIPVLYGCDTEMEQLLSKQTGQNETIEKQKEKPYFLWSTNITQHKNHKVALRALSEYYSKGGKLKCMVTGFSTEKFSPKYKGQGEEHAYTIEIRNIIRQDNNLKKNMIFRGNLPKRQYYEVLKNAEFFLHPGKGDNGNGTAFDAAWYGVFTVSSDYAPMRYYNTYFGLQMRFFNPNDSYELADTLLDAEQNREDYKRKVPSRYELRKFMVEDDEISKKIYACVRHECALFSGEKIR